MSAFITNMAQGGAGQAMGQKPDPRLDPNKPWEYTYRGANPGLTYHPNSGYGGSVQSNGPQGYGWYDFHPQAQNAMAAQQNQLQEFKGNMPHLNDILTNRAGAQISAGMDQGIHQSRQNDSNRGLLYGGLHEGNEGAIRADAAGKMAQAKSDINQGVQSTYEGMQNDTIKSGMNWQQSQQQMQNSIYERALANMMNQNKALSSVGGAVGTGVGMYLGGGTPQGAAMGGYMGNQIGSQVV